MPKKYLVHVQRTFSMHQGGRFVVEADSLDAARTQVEEMDSDAITEAYENDADPLVDTGESDDYYDTLSIEEV